jgi:predicted ATP-dependent serine protease
LDRRLNEARRLGFARVVVPPAHGRRSVAGADGLELIHAATVGEAIEAAIE